MKKYCKKCDTKKEMNEFSMNRVRTDGKQDWCKVCLNEKNKKYKKVDWVKQFVIG